MDDLFISCVTADKTIAKALADKLQQDGLTVTFILLGLGDSLVNRIEQGFRQAKYGALILSPEFFKKPWSRGELNKIAAIDREFDEESRLFPLWHQITQADIARYSPALARRVGVSANAGLNAATAELLERIRPPELTTSWNEPRLTASSSFIEQAAAETAAAPPRLNDPRYLSNVLTQYFSMGELADLAWDMNIDYEDIPGPTKSAKARELVQYVNRRGRLDELSRQVQQRRPFIS